MSRRDEIAELQATVDVLRAGIEVAARRLDFIAPVAEDIAAHLRGLLAGTR